MGKKKLKKIRCKVAGDNASSESVKGKENGEPKLPQKKGTRMKKRVGARLEKRKGQVGEGRKRSPGEKTRKEKCLTRRTKDQKEGKRGLSQKRRPCKTGGGENNTTKKGDQRTSGFRST